MTRCPETPNSRKPRLRVGELTPRCDSDDAKRGLVARVHATSLSLLVRPSGYSDNPGPVRSAVCEIATLPEQLVLCSLHVN